MDWYEEISGSCPVRYTSAQKSAFRSWLDNKLRTEGIKAHMETLGRLRHVQVTLGHPERAALVVTAHYDTPARRLLPEVGIAGNAAVFALRCLAEILLMLLPALGVYMGVYALTGSPRAGLWGLVLTYLGLLLFTRWGLACPHSANASTSGLVAALEMYTSLSPEERGQVAVILCDNGEKGWLGAKAYAKAHPQTAYTKLTVGLDRIGLGDRLLCVSTPLAMKCTGHGTLLRTLESVQGMTLVPMSSRKAFLRQDASFWKCSVSLYAARRTWCGDIVPGTRTAGDTTVHAAQLHAVAKALAQFVGKISAASATAQQSGKKEK